MVYRCLSGHRSASTNEFINPTVAVSNVSGTNFSFAIFRVASTYYCRIINAGSGYTALGTLTVYGAELGGTTGANDAVITINTVDGSGAITAVSVDGTPNVNTDGLEANQAQWETVVAVSYTHLTLPTTLQV